MSESVAQGIFWKSPGLREGLQPAHVSPGTISCLSLTWTGVRCAGIGTGLPDPVATWLPTYLEPWALPQLGSGSGVGVRREALV